MRTLLAVLVTLLLGQLGFAQMTYSYSAYNTKSNDATHIYASAVVDGSATCNNVHIQWLNCSTTTHQGQAYVMIGNTGGWAYGRR